ncbi:efflux RND transporter periplasmic adaptor subunit [Nocardioides cavernaquae]|uniref:Efflux RND transporter periplasmic adaptor subunit n=1 Tax=Nocardioides cavernaquae TaxID=2321396 RepID=A0A3A5HGE5_9ACTN|nr:efflux RND transporter periplasmic adaptor subunit [Nocardioides cavernaquae]
MVLPALWLLIGALIAASLVKLAFLGGSASAREDNPLKPTGEVPAQTVPVEVRDIENTLVVEGTIELDPAKSALSPAEGTFVYSWVREGQAVAAGERLFQIRSEGEPVEIAEAIEEAQPDARRKPRAPIVPTAPRPTYTNVVAPVAGKVSGFAVALGDPVSKGLAIASVQPRTFKAVGNITPLDRYRLLNRPSTARVTIKGGPKPFKCLQLAIGDAAAAAPSSGGEGGEMGGGEGGGEGDAATTITCRVPERVTVFDGLNMSMDVAAGAASEVLAVPVTGVRGLLGTGTVWVVGDDGLETERRVRLGITDGKVVEVRSGLKPGDNVLRYVPGAPQGEGDMEGMEGEVIYR